jgi:hypothetical protein
VKRIFWGAWVRTPDQPGFSACNMQVKPFKTCTLPVPAERLIVTKGIYNSDIEATIQRTD